VNNRQTINDKNNNNEDNKDVAKTPVTRPSATAPHVERSFSRQSNVGSINPQTGIESKDLVIN